MSLTASEITDRLEAAAITLRRLPDPNGSGARGFGSSWPDVVQDARHAYGYHRARVRVVPSARDIERMEEAIEWLSLLDDPVDRKIVWLRAENHRWRTICMKVGLVRQTCHRRGVAAVLTIERRLNTGLRSRQTRKGGRQDHDKPGRGGRQDHDKPGRGGSG